MARAVALAALLTLALSACAEVHASRTNGADMTPTDSLEGVVSRTFTASSFKLESGRVLPELTLAYESYGRLAADGRNAILVTHGFTSNHHAAGKYAATDPTPGWWDGLIGAGKTIDTDRYFVVSSNMLGSSYGSTAPRSVDPATGKPYGPEFPVITLRDIVTAQKAMLDSLGVRHLVAVAGPSFGGYQAFQWAVTFPDHMSGIVPVVTAPKGSGGEQAVRNLIDQLEKDPNWNGGWYYDRGGGQATLADMRFDTLSRHGFNEALAGSFPPPPARGKEMRRVGRTRGRQVG